MNDEQRAEDDTGAAAGAVQDQPYTRKLPVAEVDWLLESMVADANHAGAYGVPITLLTRGGTVSGIMISVEEYCQIAGEWWVQAAGESPNYGGQMKNLLTNIAETETVRLKEASDDEFNYIHLKDVRHIGDAVAPEPGMIWRGRLSEVAGFALGALSPKPVTITATSKRG